MSRLQKSGCTSAPNFFLIAATHSTTAIERTGLLDMAAANLKAESAGCREEPRKVWMTSLVVGVKDAWKCLQQTQTLEQKYNTRESQLRLVPLCNTVYHPKEKSQPSSHIPGETPDGLTSGTSHIS